MGWFPIVSPQENGSLPMPNLPIKDSRRSLSRWIWMQDFRLLFRMTRTVAWENRIRKCEIYEITLKSQQLALEVIGPGLTE